MCVCTVSPVNGVGLLHSDNTLGFRIGTYRRELLVVNSLSGSCAPVAHVCTRTHPSHPLSHTPLYLFSILSHPLTPNTPSHTPHTVICPLHSIPSSPHIPSHTITSPHPLTHHHIPSPSHIPSHTITSHQSSHSLHTQKPTCLWYHHTPAYMCQRR